MFYITRIQLENIRAFRKLNLDVSDTAETARMRTVIIGRNGTCKSTLLRCIAIGLCDPEDGNSLVAEPMGRLITEDSKEAKIMIELVSHDIDEKPLNITTTLQYRNGKEIVSDQDNPPPSPEKLFVCGYGAGRSTEGPDRFRGYRIIDSVYTLFQYEEGLIDTELTLRRLKDYLGSKTYENTMKGIKRALGLSPKAEIDLPKGGGVIVSGPSIGKAIPLQGWADGYRMTFNWIMDLYAHAMRADKITKRGGIGGIFLIDELEQHCHPSMQTDMIPHLSKLFPEMQIFTTTHSPLVALGAYAEELVVLQRKVKYVHSVDFVPDFAGYSAEDMLVDDRLFDTDVYSPETSKMLKRYRKLAAITKEQRTQTQVSELRALARKLKSQKLPEIRESALAVELRKLRKKYDL